MTRRLPLARIWAFLAGGSLFFLWHGALLSPEGRIRGLTSDSAIVGLMGKKMLEGRGFDIFFWGQNYLGPFTAILIAAFGADPLGLRLATLTLAAAGIMLTWAAIRPIDARAATLTAIALAIGPSLLIRLMINPVGAEMSFFFSSLLLLILVPMVDGHSTSPRRQFVLGVAAGIAWWMNQLVVFTLAAGAIVLFAQSRTFANARARLRWHHSPILYAGLLWFAMFVALDLAGIMLPFLLGRSTDWLLLILAPLLFSQLRDWRRWRGILDRDEIPGVLRVAAGGIIGYSPVWLGRLLGWFKPSYTVAFQADLPSGMLTTLRAFAQPAAEWIGVADGPAGLLFAISFAILLVAAIRNQRTPSRLMLALIPLGNFAVQIGARGTKMHYLIASTSALFALAALGACDLWDSRRRVARTFCVVAGLFTAISLGLKAKAMHDDLLAKPDPTVLLTRVHQLHCAVCYSTTNAYLLRFVDQERCAWIPYRDQDRTPLDTQAMERMRGQRCLVDASDVMLTAPLQRSAPFARP